MFSRSELILSLLRQGRLDPVLTIDLRLHDIYQFSMLRPLAAMRWSLINADGPDGNGT